MLIFNDQESVDQIGKNDLATRDSYEQVKFLMQILKNQSQEHYDIHLLTKALAILASFHCKTWRQTKLLYFSAILQSVKEIMTFGETSTTREGAKLCAFMI